MKRILSTLLLLAMLVSTVAATGISASALENGDMIVNIPTGSHTQAVTDVLSQSYLSAQDKLDNDPNMTLVAKNGTQELYCNPFTGEVYIKNIATGQIVGTNPYYIGQSGTNMIPATLMSQLVVNFNYLSNLGANGTDYESYTQAAARGQISVTPIRGGIRVNYTIGDTTKRYAVPYGIMKDDFIEEFVIPMQKALEAGMLELAESHIGGNPDFEENRYRFSYEAYCAEYGYEETYGNLTTYKAWYNALYKWYNSSSATYKQYLALGNLATEYFSLMSVYNEMDPNRAKGDILANMLEKYPILREQDANGEYVNAIFVLVEGLQNTQMRKYQATIQKYVDGYTLDSMYEDEDQTGVHGPEAVNPIFHVALQYVLTEDGVEITLPADSLVYDESMYVVNYVNCLPYFGTGRIEEGGYIFYPDGSGAIIDFEEFGKTNIALGAPVYGADHAFYNVTGQHQETIALPVFGTVEEEEVYYFTDPYTGERVYCTEADYLAGSYTFTFENLGNPAMPKYVTTYPNGMQREVTQYKSGNEWIDLTKDNLERASITVSDIQKSSFTNGVLSIIEEGASMSSIRVSLTPEANNPYSSIYARYAPRAKDSYNLADSMDAFTSTETFTIFADNKYVGNYTTRVIMLPDPDIAAVTDGYYPATYAGMAQAYRQRLLDTGVLSLIEDLEEQLPVFIESFGVIQATEKFLSIPFEVDKALTTFDDVETMYEELAEAGITNVKFRLTGFANGGMYATYPVKLKWESKAGGKAGYRDLLDFVSAHSGDGMEVYPNFNFSYIENTGLFDGINPKEIGARSLDNRYAIQKTYSSVYQEFTRVGGVVVSSDRLAELFAKFHKKNATFGNTAISLEHVGAELNSNFSDKNLITREDALDDVDAFLSAVQEAGYSSIMTTGGNAYALPYVKALLKAPIESSGYSYTSYAVPFWGMVMHGSLNYAGSAFNEEANKSEAILRAIESGASLYFILSYDNTQLLKDDELFSDYYSVNYEISKETLLTYYKILNDAIGDLQSYEITDHRILSVERVISESETLANIATLEEEFLQELTAYVNRTRVQKRATIVALKDLMDAVSDGEGNLPTDYSDLGAAQRARISVFLDTYETDNDIARVLDGATTNRARINRLLTALSDGTLTCETDAPIRVQFNRDLLLAEAAKQLYVSDPSALSAQFVGSIDALVARLAGDGAWSVAADAFTYESAYSFFTLSDALDPAYERTNYTLANGSVTLVTYSNGTDTVRFVLNHNVYSVRLILDGQEMTLDKYAFVRLD